MYQLSVIKVSINSLFEFLPVLFVSCQLRLRQGSYLLRKLAWTLIKKLIRTLQIKLLYQYYNI